MSFDEHPPMQQAPGSPLQRSMFATTNKKEPKMYDTTEEHLHSEWQPGCRWRVEITYRDGSAARKLMVEEIEELQGIIEHGPDWNTIDCIKIKLNRRSDAIPPLSPDDLAQMQTALKRMIKQR
jgi:hypothetical protein